jgi:hypothetical protein
MYSSLVLVSSFVFVSRLSSLVSRLSSLSSGTPYHRLSRRLVNLVIVRGIEGIKKVLRNLQPRSLTQRLFMLHSRQCPRPERRHMFRSVSSARCPYRPALFLLLPVSSGRCPYRPATFFCCPYRPADVRIVRPMPVSSGAFFVARIVRPMSVSSGRCPYRPADVRIVRPMSVSSGRCPYRPKFCYSWGVLKIFRGGAPQVPT